MLLANYFNALRFKILSKFRMIDKPLVVVLGATGTGKSKLAIEMAQRFNGEIISADSMQVYRNLDIVTAKVTREEQSMAKHHLIDFVDPLTRITVVDFRNRALELIDKIHEQKKIPIVVGGTNYYIESLLWEVLVIPGEADQSTYLFNRDNEIMNSIEGFDSIVESELTSENVFSQPILAASFQSISSEHLHNLLKTVDNEGADLLHPNDKRKIIRALQVYQRTGQKYSKFLNDQKQSVGGSSLGGPLRFKNSIIFWLQCDKDVLNQRLDDRVGSMIEKGLLKELIDFHELYNKSRLESDEEADYSKGIFQCIGFKEFHDYLLLSEDERKECKELYEHCVEEMKRVTRKYAGKQQRWVRNRFLNTDREVPPVYGLDVADLEKWDENVTCLATRIMESFLTSASPPIQSLNHKTEETVKLQTSQHKKAPFHCKDCDRVFQGSFQWEHHLSSRNHKKRVKSHKDADDFACKRIKTGQ